MVAWGMRRGVRTCELEIGWGTRKHVMMFGVFVSTRFLLGSTKSGSESCDGMGWSSISTDRLFYCRSISSVFLIIRFNNN